MRIVADLCLRALGRGLVRNCFSTIRLASKSRAMNPAQKSGIPLRMRENPALKQINMEEFQSIFTKELHTLIDIFKRNNYELRIAGGAVRDILMGIQPKDIDLATTATPDEMKEMFNKEDIRMINTKGEQHGTITPRINNKENFEVTTLRIDTHTDGRHAKVEFTTNWQLDANRRDLTINSMFLGFDGTIYDYFYGYEDLQERRVVFVGDADVRIKEDYLRILRYFRFYGRIARDAHNHKEESLQAIRNNVDGLTQISGERIWSELQKIVCGNFCRELVLDMIDCNVTPYCGLPKTPNIEDFNSLFMRLEQFPKPHLPILYMISLVHTIEDVITLHQRLKLSGYERDLALFITQRKNSAGTELRTLRDCQKLCMEPYMRQDFIEQLLKYIGNFDLYTKLKTWQKPKFPINGSILKEHNVPTTHEMGIVISRLRAIWCDSDFSMTADELLTEHLPAVLNTIKAENPSGTPSKLRKTS